MMDQRDKRNRFDHEVFSYRATKDGKVFLFWQGKQVKVLKGQGPAAPLGELDFVVKDVMIGGFALIASPAQYRNTGVKTFMVSHDGVVYQKDLGPKTLELFQTIDRFNPDKTWTPVLDQ